MGWLSGWEYRKKITIQGQSGAGSNYAVHLRIGSSSGGDLHLEGHCQNFPHDIRFTKDDGETELYYWIEDLNADPIDVWVKVTDSLDTNKDIYVYYGKSGAQTTRDGDNTFDFFDDFPGSSVDTNKWIDSAFYGEVANSKLRVKAPIGMNSRVTSHTCFEKPKQLVMKALLRDESSRWDHGGFNWMIKDCDNSDAYVACYSKIDAYGRCASRANTEGNTRYCGYVYPAWEHAVWRRYHIKWTGSKVIFWLSPSTQYYECTTRVPQECMRVKLGNRRESGAPDTYSEFDWVFVAPFHDPEPTFLSASSEEHCAELAGSSSATSSLISIAKRLRFFLGTSPTQSTIQAPLTLSWSLSAQTPAQSSTSAPLSVLHTLSTTCSALTSNSSVLKPTRHIFGSTPSVSSITALLKPNRRLISTIPSQSTASSSLTLSYTLFGSSTASTSLTSDLLRSFTITGIISSFSTTNAIPTLTRNLISTLTPLSTIQGSLHQSYAISGSSTPSSHLTGFTLPVLFLSGSFNPTSTAQSSLTRTRSIVGLFTGSTSCCGLLSLIFLLRSFGKPFVPLSCRSFKWRDVRL